jgi:hypothetical protein
MEGIIGIPREEQSSATYVGGLEVSRCRDESKVADPTAGGTTTGRWRSFATNPIGRPTISGASLLITIDTFVP